MDGLHEAAAATAGATRRPSRATRRSRSMREASDSEWELIDVGGETEYWDTRVGGDENYLGEGAFRWRRCGASGAASPALSSTRSNGRATRRTRTPGRRRRTCLPISSRSGTGSERQRQREARHARGGGRRSGGGVARAPVAWAQRVRTPPEPRAQAAAGCCAARWRTHWRRSGERRRPCWATRCRSSRRTGPTFRSSCDICAGCYASSLRRRRRRGRACRCSAPRRASIRPCAGRQAQGGRVC
mmetsp:Transcript_4796/g.14663  ORF Transcript_4796/g.14663 Transcript_4796/m.14663 type:complete len:244 (+) Transcript_4796:340-1071(+)